MTDDAVGVSTPSREELAMYLREIASAVACYEVPAALLPAIATAIVHPHRIVTGLRRAKSAEKVARLMSSRAATSPLD